jgi:hypothetical protein
MRFTLKDMERFALEAWGPFGAKVVERWVELNDRYFDGKLKPIPLVLTHAQPYGKRLAFCSHNPNGAHHRTITLNVPHNPGAAGSYALLADNGALTHEMIHQLLQQRGVASGHDSEGWRKEIMRLNLAIAGREIWAGKSMTKRVIGEDGKKSKVIRINQPKPDGTPSLTQDEIARWPHTCGINLGRLGDSLRTRA